jgi:hypothetical protein
VYELRECGLLGWNVGAGFWRASCQHRKAQRLCLRAGA